MCGIAGFIGHSGENAEKILLESLARLEYRGYDSAGIAVMDGGRINVTKSEGKLLNLREKLEKASLEGTCGIGHTRWATHGEANETNSHPHTSPSGNIVLVHNGIIENHDKLRKRLTADGYEFKTQTDTETAVFLIDSYYKGNPLEAIAKAAQDIEGSYALAILFADFPNTIFTTRRESPLAVYASEGRAYIASDAPAIVPYTKDVIYLANGDIAKVSTDGIEIYDASLNRIEKAVTHIDWDVAEAQKGGYPHFMLKEIYEQPEATARADHNFSLGGEIGGNIKRVIMTACGSAYHVCCVAKSVLESVTGICAEIDVASEFRYRKPRLSENDLFVAVSQSGETADTLAALRYANEAGALTVAIVNVVGSSIAREAKRVIYTHAGPEIAVATTKAYSAQLIAFYRLIAELALSGGYINKAEYDEFRAIVSSVPSLVKDALSVADEMEALAKKYHNVNDVYFIGRGIDHAAALEGSLKLKEISYIHSEAYAAGELKHGTISLIEKGTPVIVLATMPELYDKTASNAAECASRGAELIAIVANDCHNFDTTAKHIIRLPSVGEYANGKFAHLISASLAVISMQIFSYHVSLDKGNDPDKPRNLAKSVTVE